jgi:hypothetical protein
MVRARATFEQKSTKPQQPFRSKLEEAVCGPKGVNLGDYPKSKRRGYIDPKKQGEYNSDPLNQD